jgi:Transposase, Mutator family
VADVFALTDRQRPDRGAPGHQRRPRRAFIGDRGHCARRGLAAIIRTHYAANLMAITPKSSCPWVKTLLYSVFDQSDAQSVAAQYDRIVDALSDKLPKVADHLEHARADLLAFTAFPNRSGAKSGPTTPRNASTKKSAVAPMLSAPSPTVTPSSASSARSWPNNATNGPNHAATWASTSSANRDSPPIPPQNRRPPPQH